MNVVPQYKVIGPDNYERIIVKKSLISLISLISWNTVPKSLSYSVVEYSTQQLVLLCSGMELWKFMY